MSYASFDAVKRALNPIAAATPQTRTPSEMPITVAKADFDPCDTAARNINAVSTPGIIVKSPATNAKPNIAETMNTE